MVSSTLNRLLVVGCLADETRRSLPFSISDNSRVGQMCGWLLKSEDDQWHSGIRSTYNVHDSLQEGLGVLDELLDLEFLKQNIGLNVADGYNLLIIADRSCNIYDLPIIIHNELNHRGLTNGPKNTYKLHIDEPNIARGSLDDVSFYVENITEAGSIVSFEGEEWAALIVQLIEFLVVIRHFGQESGDRFALGYSSIGLNIAVGRNFLAAKAKDWLLERELREIDLDETLRNANPIIRKFSHNFGELVSQQGHPPCDDLLGQVGITNPSTVAALNQYVNRVKDSDLLTDIDDKLSELVRQIEESISTALDDLKTVIERRALAQAISGIFPDYVSGKPLRDWETIYRLYDEPLIRLSELGVKSQELDELDHLSTALESAKDVNYLIGECKGEIYRAKELGKPTENLENTLKELTSKFFELKATSIEVAERCRANLKKLFAQVDKELVSTRVATIIEEAQFDPPPPPPPLEPVFAPWVLFRMLYTILPSLLWLIVELKWDVLHLGASIVVFLIVAVVWVVVIAKRLNREKPKPLDVETTIRNKFRRACSEIAELYTNTRALQKFNLLMEQGILFTLEKEMRNLDVVVQELNNHLARAKEYQEVALPDVSSEVTLTDKDSYNRYFKESLLSELPGYQHLLDDEGRLEDHRNRKSSEAVSKYVHAVEQFCESRITELTQFQMFHYLLNGEVGTRPSFLKRDLSSVAKLIRDAKLNMSILHSQQNNSQTKLYIFRYSADKEAYLVKQFDGKLSNEFEESATGNLFHIDTPNANRLSLLALKKIIA